MSPEVQEWVTRKSKAEAERFGFKIDTNTVKLHGKTVSAQADDGTNLLFIVVAGVINLAVG